MILEASMDSYPNEFGALLRAEDHLIYEIAIMPGTIGGDHHTIFQLYNKPIDFSIVGSVHSHPSGVVRPSDADLNMFSNSGPVHIIVGFPYLLENFAAFDRKGEKIDMKVL